LPAIVVGPGSGVALQARGNTLRFKAMGAGTRGAFSLFEREVPPNARRPAMHRHPAMTEAFYVLDGELALVADGIAHVVPSGGFALVPAGAAHTFGNDGPAPLRMLVLHSPALDGYFAELDALDRSGTLNGDTEADLMRRHGLEPA
jgi:quercetin dioxygenase-like cupin family protein